MHQFLHYARRLCVTTLCGLCGLKFPGWDACGRPGSHNPLRVVWIEIGKFGRNTIPGHVTTLCGLCGLKYFSVNYFYTFTKVTTLCGLCGLKSSVLFIILYRRFVTTLCGLCGLKFAIQGTAYEQQQVTTLCGLCGLKLVNPPADIVIHCHNPLRVVWIEIALQQSEGIRGKSQPFAGCVD